jgi:sporulation protein YlmC with PRC-barrel domain
MKRTFLILVGLIGFAISINAQILQNSMYNDGNLLVIVERKNDRVEDDPRKLPSRKIWKDVKVDELTLENISSGKITIKYCFKCISRDFYDNFVEEKIIYRDRTLSTGEKIRERANELRSGRYSYVDSFAVMNVQYENVPESNSNSFQEYSGTPSTVPSVTSSNPETLGPGMELLPNGSYRKTDYSGQKIYNANGQRIGSFSGDSVELLSNGTYRVTDYSGQKIYNANGQRVGSFSGDSVELLSNGTYRVTDYSGQKIYNANGQRIGY